jgi:hypothetical protein
VNRANETAVPAPVLRLFEVAGLQPHLQRPARELAHGLKQALDQATAIAARPDAHLLDEPTAGLTANEREKIGEVFQHLARDAGVTVILIEHDLDFVLRIADRVAVLHDGRVIECSTPDVVAQSPVVRFTEAEISQALTEVAAANAAPAADTEAALAEMRLYYNGYRFSDLSPGEPMYNPTLALYFLLHFQEQKQPPSNMLDSSLGMDRGKLHYIAALPGGPQVIVDALQDDASLSVPVLSDRFGVEDMLTARKDRQFMASLLYYFGVLTLNGRGPLRKLLLRIPNLAMRKLYIERLQALLLPQAEEDDARQAAETVYLTGDLGPLCEFVEQRYFKVFDNRDYGQANELTLKTAFLTLLFNDLLYISDSETAVGQR